MALSLIILKGMSLAHSERYRIIRQLMLSVKNGFAWRAFSGKFDKIPAIIHCCWNSTNINNLNFNFNLDFVRNKSRSIVAEEITKSHSPYSGVWPVSGNELPIAKFNCLLVNVTWVSLSTRDTRK